MNNKNKIISLVAFSLSYLAVALTLLIKYSKYELNEDIYYSSHTDASGITKYDSLNLGIPPVITVIANCFTITYFILHCSCCLGYTESNVHVFIYIISQFVAMAASAVGFTMNCQFTECYAYKSPLYILSIINIHFICVYVIVCAILMFIGLCTKDSDPIYGKIVDAVCCCCSIFRSIPERGMIKPEKLKKEMEIVSPSNAMSSATNPQVIVITEAPCIERVASSPSNVTPSDVTIPSPPPARLRNYSDSVTNMPAIETEPEISRNDALPSISENK